MERKRAFLYAKRAINEEKSYCNNWGGGKSEISSVKSIEVL
jgi:hypothetical protein